MVFISPNWSTTASDFRTLANQVSNKRSYERFLAMALIIEGKLPGDVATTLNRSYQTVLNWATINNDGGVEGLHYKSPPGQQPLLNKEQMEILKLAVNKSPNESNINSIGWTYKEVIIFIQREFNITIK